MSRRTVLRSGAVVAGGVTGTTAVSTEAAGAAGRSAVLFENLFAALREQWPANRAITVAWHGHSVPAGYHVTPQNKPFESYPFMVHQGLNARFPTAVIDRMTTAIGGENSVSGARRFRRDVLRREPDLVFVDYAINDRAVPLPDVEAAWRQMIEAAAAGRTPIVLLTPTGTRFDDLSDPANVLSVRAALIRDLGQEYGLPVGDSASAWQDELDAGTDQETLLSQGLHPNAAGHAIAASVILRTIDRLAAG